MIRAIGNGDMFGVCDLSRRPDIYELAVRQEMKELGAKGSDFDVLSHDVVWRFCSKHIPPETAALIIMAKRTDKQ